MSRLDKIRQDRQKKVNQLRELGIDPYPSVNLQRTSIADVRTKQGASGVIAGRIMSIRGHGRLTFIDLQDTTAQVQLMIKSDQLSPDYLRQVEFLDVGDAISASGDVTTSQRGEISVLVNELHILSKSIRPLPEKWHGLTDVEERYRQRYLDLVINPDVKKVFLTRTKIVTLLRQYLDTNGFIEVETPVLQPIYGGAMAKPFTTQHNALDSQFYLRISDELYLKRLVVGGFEKVYEMSKDFRNEGMSREHNPEFTMLEFYWAYADYNKLMEFTEQMLSHIVKEVSGSMKVMHQEHQYDLTPPWPRVTFRDLINEHLQIDINQIATEEALVKVIRQRQLLEGPLIGYGKILDQLYKHHIRPKLQGPLFLLDYPADLIPLAKKLPQDPSKVATFQLLIAGHEYIKAYNELNDPQDQRARWEEEARQAEAGADEYQMLDEDYLRALEYGMPPTAGWGMGIDRFTAFVTDQPTLKDVILFPTLRPEQQGSSLDKSTSETGPFQATNTESKTPEQFYIINTDAKRSFPELKTGIAVIRNVDINKTHTQLEQQKAQLLSKFKSLTTEEINQFPTIVAYRNLFKKFGADWHSHRPSPEALLRRLAQGKGLYTVNTLVDAYNLAVIETKLGMSAMDLDQLQLPVTLRTAQSNEQILLLGEQTPSTVQEGSLIYADTQNILTMDFNYRDSDHTKVTTDTKNILLFIDGCQGIETGEIESGLQRATSLIQQYCGGEVTLAQIIA